MNLLDLVKSQLTDDVLGKLAGTLGESATGTQKAVLNGALPAVLAGLVNRYGGEAGAGQLLDLLRSGGHDGSMLNNLNGALAGGAQTDSLLNLGKGLLGSLLGSRADAVTDLLASFSGVRRASASSMLGLAVPIVLGVLGKQVQSGALGASGIAGALAAVKDVLAGAAAPGLASAMGLSDFSSTGAAGSGERKGAIWPWLLVPAVALALFFGLRGCQQNAARSAETAPPAERTPAAAIAAEPARVTAAVPVVADPATVAPAVTAPSPPALAEVTAGMSPDSVAYELAQFLADPNLTTPHSFVLRNLNFDSGTARISASSQATTGDVAKVLVAYSTAKVALQGYTDDRGNAGTNRKLSQARADAVRDALISLGVAPERLGAAGFGAENPLQSNATPLGRANNRRTELLVTAK